MTIKRTRARGVPVRSRTKQDSFALYLREIGEHALLEVDEELELARRVRSGDTEALHRLVAGNLRFVVAVAKRYRHFGVPLPDLVTEGNIGLIRAAERFDDRRGVRFTSYAIWWIRQSIVAALRQQAGMDPTGATGVHYLSLDAPAGVDERTQLGELVTREPSGDPADRAERNALRDVLEASLTLLDSREASVLRLYYGLAEDREPLSLADIGARLGVSRERVRQIRERALSRLRTGVRRSDLESFFR